MRLHILGVVLVATALVAPAGFAQESWKDLKHESKRMKLDEVADETLAYVLKESDKARLLFDNSYGWAAFDNLKLQFGLAGGGGRGVAVAKESGDRTYMAMGTGGVGLGIGGQKYQLLFLFQDKATFDNFVNVGWQAEASASATAGDEGVAAGANFRNGLAYYQVTDKGLMAGADISGTKYWKDGKLNN